jgi:hypothetical protein
MAPERDNLEQPPRASGVVVRPVLSAGLAFVDAARESSFHARELTRWLHAWLVTPGLMEMPATIHEPGTGTVSLVPDGAGSAGAWAGALDARFSRIVATARTRIEATLSGLVASPVDDRFLAAAIFARRVERTSGEHGSTWRATPKAEDRLSDVVLSLFAADALSNREEYDACLCVCDLCGRIAFRPDALARNRCEAHERDSLG